MGKPRTRYSPKQKKMSEPGLSGTTELDIPPTKYGKQTTPGTLPSRSAGQRRDQPRTKPPRGKKRSSKGSTPLSHTKKQALSRSFTPQGPGSLLTDSTTSESTTAKSTSTRGSLRQHIKFMQTALSPSEQEWQDQYDEHLKTSSREIAEAAEIRNAQRKRATFEFNGDPGKHVQWTVQWLEIIGNPDLALSLYQVYKLNSEYLHRGNKDKLSPGRDGPRDKNYNDYHLDASYCEFDVPNEFEPDW